MSFKTVFSMVLQERLQGWGLTFWLSRSHQLELRKTACFLNLSIKRGWKKNVVLSLTRVDEAKQFWVCFQVAISKSSHFVNKDMRPVPRLDCRSSPICLHKRTNVVMTWRDIQSYDWSNVEGNCRWFVFTSTTSLLKDFDRSLHQDLK